MHKNKKMICYDDQLQLEAYRFEGTVQAFPNHFHDYYVLGLIEAGERRLIVNNIEYQIGPGDLMTFNPMDNHACEQTDGGELRYLCLNIKRETMEQTVKDILGQDELPHFRGPVQCRTELGDLFREIHHGIVSDVSELEKEELYVLFFAQLLSNHAAFGSRHTGQTACKEIEDVCIFMQQRYAQRITLDMLSEIARLNKYSLVRLFTRRMGITPYRYLETLRISEAKKLLEHGVSPAQAALQTGFSDQSHFTSYFSRFIGLTPGQYQAIFREDG